MARRDCLGCDGFMNHKPLIGVIHGASRQGRLSEVPAHWIYELAAQRADLRLELIDIGGHPLPFLRPEASPRTHGNARRWDAVFERLDGFVVIVPEDDVRDARGDGPQAIAAAQAFMHKPVAFVGFGKHAGMARVASLRSHAMQLRMAPVSQDVHLSMSEVMRVWQTGSGLDEHPHLARAALALLDELAWWSLALKTARKRPSASPETARHPCAQWRMPLQRMKGLVRGWIRRIGEASVRAGGRSAGRALSWPR